MKAFVLTGGLALGLAGFGTTALAQQAPPAPAASARPALQPPGEVSRLGMQYKKYLQSRYAGDKRALAVVHLFGRKQRGGLLWLLGGAGVVTTLAAASGSHSSGSGTFTLSVSPVGYVVFGGLPLFIGGRKLIRFGNGQLYEAMQMHDLTGSFPDYVENKLRDRDYK